GKAHRLDLSARPSPIPTAESRQSGQPNRAERRRRARAAASPGSLPPPAPPPPRVITCSWPLGDPGRPDFHFCDATALPSKPYCAAHAERAYVRVRDKREEAA
ncbi:GcrA family cell cycle regulator, partial [Acidiphilium sp.]|uniref:GcrA family cell cycle regulator n=1 Tax=Acidiphilium sp. TaxID=527 RepID=UPI00258292ED